MQKLFKTNGVVRVQRNAPSVSPLAAQAPVVAQRRVVECGMMRDTKGPVLVCHATVQTTEQAVAEPVQQPKPQEQENAKPPARTPHVDIPQTSTKFDHAIMLQGFGWDSHSHSGWYKHLQEKIPDMKAAGITHLWLPPPSDSVSPQGYMPGQLYNLESEYGNKDELVALNKALKEAGIKPICDIVINHRTAQEQRDGVWNKFRDDVDHEGKKIDWGRWAITSTDPHFKGTGNPDSGADWEGAPDLDHHNPELRAALIDWMRWLKDEVGFEGWRLDFSKGYAAEYVKEYMEATTPEELNVGEFWTDLNWDGGCLNYDQDAARQTLVDWINGNGKTATAFDFPTKGILQEAVKNTEYWRLRDKDSKASGAIGWLSSRIVTFIANHDTDSSQQHWPFPESHLGLGNAYILTHPGIPCVFWEHLMDNNIKETIQQLVALRKRNGINSRSKLHIEVADHDLYVARIDDRVVIKMGPRHDIGDLAPKAEEGWSLAVSGNDFAVWEKKEGESGEKNE